MQTDELKAERLKHSKEVLGTIQKAKKNLRLYPSNNPVYAKTVDMMLDNFKEFFQYGTELEYKIGRNEIIFDDESVYVGEGKDDNLALFFFRDGLRNITFKTGLSRQELLDFMEIISQDFDSEDVEDDLVTLLWEKDFQNIVYTVDEAMLVDDEGYQDTAIEQAKENVCDDEYLKQAYEEAFMEDKHGQEKVEMMPITDEDLKALMVLIEKDSEDKLGKLVNIIFDMLTHAEEVEEYKDVAAILSNAIEFSLRRQDMKLVLYIMKRTRASYDTARSAAGKKHLAQVFAFVSSASMLNRLRDIMETGARFDDKGFAQFVGMLGPTAIEPFISMLGAVKSAEARKRISMALNVLGRKDVLRLSRGLSSENVFVVRNVIYILRQIKDARAADGLVRVCSHSDANVRRESIIALGEVGGTNAAIRIRSYLDDPSDHVRVTAAKVLAKIGSDHARQSILEKVLSKGLLETAPDEMKVYFEALARWKDPPIVELMKKIIGKRHVFNRSSHNDMKACAVHCLAQMGSGEALAALSEVASSGKKPFSDQAAAAIKRIEQHGR